MAGPDGPVPADGGRFYGIGLGPGDPGLVTRRAHRLLRDSSRILCPATTSEGPGRAAAVLGRLEGLSVRPSTYRLDVHAEPSERRRQYRRAADEVVRGVRAGEIVSAVTLGDPTLYSTVSHLREALRGRLPAENVEMVPGVASPQAAACLDGRGLATGDRPVTLLPGTADPEALSDALASGGAGVLLKPRGRFERIRGRLRDAGVLERSVLVEEAGWEPERVVPLPELAPDYDPPYFSLIVVYPPSR